jgi:Uma2 family endonuclease
MSTQASLTTAAELFQLPDNGQRRELVAGELREMAPSGHEHGRIIMRLSVPLGQYVEAHRLGAVYAAETGFQLARDPDTVRAPDIAFVANDRLASVPQGPGFFPGAPDLAVEVVSPGDTYAEVESKVGQWLEAGSRMVLVVNPRNRTLKVYRSLTELTVLTENDLVEGADVVPGFQIPVSNIFP